MHHLDPAEVDQLFQLVPSLLPQVPRKIVQPFTLRERAKRTPKRKRHLALPRLSIAGGAYSAAIGAAILQFFGLSAAIILMPFYLVEARGFSTLGAGGIMAAFPLAMLLISSFSGTLSDRLGRGVRRQRA